MTTLTGSPDFRPIEFPKQWFATPWKEREQIFEALVNRELALADSVLNPTPPTEDWLEKSDGSAPIKSSSSDDYSPSSLLTPGEFSYRSFREDIIRGFSKRLPPPRRRPASLRVPCVLESWQERNKKINKRIDSELEKTDKILLNAKQFKQDLLQWMERLKEPPPDPFFSPRDTEESGEPTGTESAVSLNSSIQPTPPEAATEAVPKNETSPNEDPEQLAKQEERLRTSREKYESQQAARRIIKSLKDHLRVYLKLDPVGAPAASKPRARGSQSSDLNPRTRQSTDRQRNKPRSRRAASTGRPQRPKTMWDRTRPDPSSDWRKELRKPATSQSAKRSFRSPVTRALLARRQAEALPPISQRLAPRTAPTAPTGPSSPALVGSRRCTRSLTSVDTQSSEAPMYVRPLALSVRRPADARKKTIEEKWKYDEPRSNVWLPPPEPRVSSKRPEVPAQRDQERAQTRSGDSVTQLTRAPNQPQGQTSPQESKRTPNTSNESSPPQSSPPLRHGRALVR